jgi:hypothetical protein
MMKVNKAIVFIGWLLLTIVQIHAQSNTIEIGTVIESTLAVGETQSYELTALETSIISLHAEALDTELDPMIQIFDSSGKLIITNDDYNYPTNRDAIIQTFVIPRTDTYTIEISAFTDTLGSYRLSILPGYDTLVINDTATSQSNWQSSNNQMSPSVIDDKLRVEIEGISQTSNLIAEDFPIGEDYYFEATFADISATTNWQVGIVFRYISPTLFYRLVVNDQGYWQLEWVNGDDVAVIQSWSTHPGIIPGATEFTVGILTSGGKFDIAYDYQLIATVYDNNIMQPGHVGVTAITANALASRVAFSLKRAIMTIPTLVNDQLNFPEILVANNYTALAHTLERQKVIPIGGEVKLTTPQSVVRNIDPGVSRFSVASGIEFTEFVMGATLSWAVIGEGIGGCGLTFNTVDDDSYALAYINMAGEYGVSQRDGDTFIEGIYGNNLIMDATSHEIIIIAYGNVIHYYIDGQHVGTMPYTPVAGEIRTAIVNFDGIDTTCTIDNLWLWSLDTASS